MICLSTLGGNHILTVQIDGNVKNGVHIAGLFSISQFGLELNMGKIESLSTTGAIKVCQS
jgi:hypothetical protein